MFRSDLSHPFAELAINSSSQIHVPREVELTSTSPCAMACDISFLVHPRNAVASAMVTASRESEYESGRFAPQLEKAAKLAVASEVTLDELVGRDTPGGTEDVRDPKLRASVRALEAAANRRYLDAASLAIDGFASLARGDEFEARRPRRRKT
jgi:transcriptional regulator with XRE-family HTH domain